MVVMYVLVRHFFNKKKDGVIYILVVHYEGEETGAEVLKQLGSRKYQIKSKTLRKGRAELTVEIMSKPENMSFVEKIAELQGVSDVNLIQYNGEYNG